MEVDVASWENYLRPEHHCVPLHALNYTLTRRIGLYLDQDVEDVNMGDVIGNFGGLAELAGFDGLEIQAFERQQNSGRQVLNDWKVRDDLNPTVGRLVEFLLEMGREDILTDLHPLICADVEAFLARAQGKAVRTEAPIQDETVTAGPGADEIPRLICLLDVMTGRQNYFDAFVCYNPCGESQRDLDFVKEMSARLQAEPYNLRLFVPGRDDLVGLNEHKIITTIISKRCRHMIVVLSHNFLESEVAEFQSSFAFALSPAARRRRIVPVRLDDCPTPNIMRIMAMCDFTKRDLWDWSWERLAVSVRVKLNYDDFVLVNDSGEAMDEDPDAPDSAIGSATPSLESSSSQVRPSAPQSNTAPVECMPPGASTSLDVTLVRRPFTTNFPMYNEPQKSSSNPNLASLKTSQEKSSSNPDLPTSRKAAGPTKGKTKTSTTSIMKRVSETLNFKKSPKKDKKGATATTSF